jgi:hypothetical protein
VGTEDGTNAEHTVASDLCMKAVQKNFAHDNPSRTDGPTVKWVQDTLKLLRGDWTDFISDPQTEKIGS